MIHEFAFLSREFLIFANYFDVILTGIPSSAQLVLRRVPLFILERETLQLSIVVTHLSWDMKRDNEVCEKKIKSNFKKIKCT